MNIRSFLSIDFLAGVTAGAWAIAAQHVASLEVLASPEVAAGFALAALGRWALASRQKE